MLTIYKISRWMHSLGIPLIPRMLYILNRIIFSVVLPPSAIVGDDVLFGYSGLGIVVHARARIGNRVKIGPHVTIGGRSGYVDVPNIEDDVEIGAGARILGSITLGKGCKIGANAVVLNDVPPGAIAVGMPAKYRAPSKE